MPKPRDWAAWAAAAAALWVGLGTYGLVEPSDARYAEIAREMWASGDWIFPRLLGIHHFHKPPLIYWLSALGQTVFGPGEWGARACLGALGTGLALLVWRFARRHAGADRAPWAVLFVCTTPAVIGAARMLTTDLALAVCQTALLTSWYDLWTGRGGRGSRWTLWLAAGFAFLAKGPVGWLAPALVIVVFWLLHRSSGDKNRVWGFKWGLPLALVVALPWYGYAIATTPGLLQYFVGGQLASRLKSGGMGHTHPWFYYLGLWPALGLPWITLAPSGLGVARRGGNPLATFLALWALVPPVLFTLSATKLPLYVLVSYPAVALLAAAALPRGGIGVRLPLRVTGGLFLAGGLALAVLGLGVIPLKGGDLATVSKADLRELLLPLGLVFGVGGSLALAWTVRGAERLGAAAAALAAVLVLVPAWGFTRGDALPLRSARTVGRAAAKRLGPGIRLIAYRDLASGLAFYTGRLPLLAGIHRETQFEDDPEERLIGLGRFLELWSGPDKVLTVTRIKHRDDLPGGTELARGNGYVLVENR